MPAVLHWHLSTCDQFEEKRLHKQTRSSFTQKNKNKKIYTLQKLQISSENYLSLFLQQLNNPNISKEIASAVSTLELV